MILFIEATQDSTFVILTKKLNCGVVICQRANEMTVESLVISDLFKIAVGVLCGASRGTGNAENCSVIQV